MKRRFLPLIGALLLLSGLVSAALLQGESADTVSPTPISVSAPAPAEGPAAPADLGDKPVAEPATEPATAAEPERVVTGCGKPTPCPDRSCEDCPRNIYLR